MKYSKGPWQIELDLVDDGDINVVQEGFTDGSTTAYPIALIDCREGTDDTQMAPREEALGNAKLTAAAPEMYEALKEIVSWKMSIAPPTVALMEMAEKAIKKAEEGKA